MRNDEVMFGLKIKREDFERVLNHMNCFHYEIIGVDKICC